MKNILVVGASQGIGLQIAQILKTQNVNLITISRTQNEALQSLASTHVTLDVLQQDAFNFELPEQIDGVVYCPGSINLKPFARLSTQDFLNDYQQNVLGAVKILQYVLPNLKKASNGASVVLFSTVAAKVGMPFHASIAAAKAGVEGLTKSLAAELAPNNIRVNAIAPSLTNTPLAQNLLNTPEKLEASNKRHPLGRIGQATDIAEMASFLLDAKASWITGQIFNIDGGMSSIK